MASLKAERDWQIPLKSCFELVKLFNGKHVLFLVVLPVLLVFLHNFSVSTSRSISIVSPRVLSRLMALLLVVEVATTTAMHHYALRFVFVDLTVEKRINPGRNRDIWGKLEKDGDTRN